MRGWVKKWNSRNGGLGGDVFLDIDYCDTYLTCFRDVRGDCGLKEKLYNYMRIWYFVRCCASI